MGFDGWVTLLGILLLTMALSSAWVQRLPVSTAAIYLGVGVLLGPWGLAVVRLDVVQHAALMQRFTEVAVVLSLFVGGLRLRLPWRDRAWHAAYRLASLVMVLSIAGLAFLGWRLLHLDPAVALLAAAILAPTDPVLAGTVTVGHAADQDRLRYGLSGEAGLNDGTAAPFVVLGLLALTGRTALADLLEWGLRDLLWASVAGLVIGFTFGRLVGRVAITLRSRQRDTAAPTDFLALALIALSYTTAQAVGAWGFLAVFAAGVGLRRAELLTVQSDPHPQAEVQPDQPHPPAETLVTPNVVTEEEIEAPAVAAGVLVAEVYSFGDTVERLLEVLLVVTVGIVVASYLSVPGLLLGVLLLFVVRPLVTFLCLWGTTMSPLQRGLIGWFGIRGIGSLYYLTFVMGRGISETVSRELAALTISTVALSIVVHGISVQPLMAWYERRRSQRRAPRQVA